MAEQPTIQPLSPGQSIFPTAAQPEPHETIAEVLTTLRSAQRHRDDMQSGVYIKITEADLASVITRLEQAAQQSLEQPLLTKKL